MNLEETVIPPPALLADTDAQILDALPIQIWTASPEGLLTFVNQHVCDYFGSDRDRLLGEGWQHMVHPADLPEVIRRWTHSLATGEPYFTEFRLLRAADRQFRWHEARALPKGDDEQRIIGWTGTNLDVDAAVRLKEVHAAAMEQVRLERDRVRRLFAQVPIAMSVLLGPDHRIDQMNACARRMLGNRNLEGRSVREALPELEGQGLFEALDAVYASGVSWESHETQIRFDRAGNGSLEDAWFDLIYHPLKNEEGTVYGVVSVSVEVTEHVRARENVARLAAEREIVLSQLSQGIIITDETGKITFINEAAKALHGVAQLNIPPEEYSDAYQLLTLDEHPHPYQDLPLARAILKGETVRGERWKVRRPDGQMVTLEGEARPVHAEAGRLIGAVLLHQQVD